MRPLTKNVGVCANTAVPAALHVLAHALQIDVVVHLGVVARHVELQSLGVAAQMRGPSSCAWLSNSRSCIGQNLPCAPAHSAASRGEQRVRMHFLERKMTKDEADAAREALEQQLDRGRRLLAVRTFEVAVFDDRDAGVRGTDRVIGRVDGDRQFERAIAIAFALDRILRQPLVASAGSALVLFHDVGRANMRVADLMPGLAPRAALAQQVPILVQLDLHRRKLFAFRRIERASLEEVVLFRDQFLNVRQHRSIVRLLLHDVPFQVCC